MLRLAERPARPTKEAGVDACRYTQQHIASVGRAHLQEAVNAAFGMLMCDLLIAMCDVDCTSWIIIR